MQRSDRGISLSASDLVGHLNCRFLTKLDCEVAFGERDKPLEDSARLEAIRRRGFEHEARYVEHLRNQGLKIEDVGGDRITPETVERTVSLMKQGAYIIVTERLRRLVEIQPKESGGNADEDTEPEA